jgi:hypothetical protein
VQLPGGKVQDINEDIAGISQISDGGGEEVLGSKERIIIPAFKPVRLHEATRVEVSICEIAVQ